MQKKKIIVRGVGLLSFLSLLLISETTYSQSSNCSNFWINPRTGETECFGETNSNSKKKEPISVLNSSLNKRYKNNYNVFFKLKNNTDKRVINLKIRFKVVREKLDYNFIVREREIVYAGSAPLGANKVFVHEIWPNDTLTISYPIPVELNSLGDSRYNKRYISVQAISYDLVDIY